MVRDSPRRIAAPHGISPLERDLLTEGLDYVARKGPLAFISIEAGQGPNAEPTVRKMSRKVKTDIALMQSRAYASAVLGRGDACEGS